MRLLWIEHYLAMVKALDEQAKEYRKMRRQRG